MEIKNYRALVNNISDGVYFVNKERRITFWNRAAEKITGYTAKEVVETFCYHNLLRHIDEEGEELCLNGCPLSESITSGELIERDVFLHHKSGYRVPIHVKVIPIFHNDEIIGAIEIFKKISNNNSEKQKEKGLQSFSMYDPLTTLPNAKYIYKMINLKINELSTLDNDYGLLVINIDDLHEVNDQYSRSIGESVIKTVAQTLKLNIRTDDIIGRWHDDQFVAILTLNSKEELSKMADRLRILVEKSITYTDKHEIRVTVSIGGAFINESDNVSGVVSRAESLMTTSKGKGKNRITIND